jgi:hypothetical protein
MAILHNLYPATFSVEYLEQHNKLTTLFRIIWCIPVFILYGVLTSSGGNDMIHQASREVSRNGASIGLGLTAATALMLLFRQSYPRWWFDFSQELNRFTARIGSYLFLLTDRYPSATDEQAVHVNFIYPNVRKELNRWLPIIKWFLAIPHYVILFVLIIAALLSTFIAWFCILFTGKYPKNLFDFVVGVGRWSTRVEAYAFMLVTDEYPPFTLK